MHETVMPFFILSYIHAFLSELIFIGAIFVDAQSYGFTLRHILTS